MPFVFVNEGELYNMGKLQAGMNADACVFGLYVNAVDIELDSVIGDLVEASFAGYSQLGGGLWEPPLIDVDGFARIEHPVRIWTKTAGLPDDEEVYGWFLYNPGEDVLIGGERFPAPILMEVDGTTVTVHPVLTGQSKFEP